MSSSSHSFSQAKINQLYNSSNEEINLSDLVHDADIADFVEIGAVNTAIEGYLEDYTLTSGLDTVVDGLVDDKFAAEGVSISSLAPLTTRYDQAIEGTTTDDTPTMLYSIIPGALQAMHLDGVVIARSSNPDAGDDLAFSAKFSLLALKPVTGDTVYTLTNGEVLKAYVGTSSMDVSFDISGGNSLRILATGHPTKTVRWSVFLNNDSIEALADA